MKTEKELIAWLLQGDVSIQYQVYRDLLDTERPDLKERIAREGWGARFLARRNTNGHWGQAYYQPKWISTHYTLLDLKYLGLPCGVKAVDDTLTLIFDHEIGPDGGINSSPTIRESDVCMNGMMLNIAAYFKSARTELYAIIDFILSQHMPDGGFNCYFNRPGASHGSLHSTLSVAEGIREYIRQGYDYRSEELLRAESASQEFILQHRLYKSDRTGDIIDKKMLMLSYPSRWRYDILRALDYFRLAGRAYDPRMEDAMAVLLKKRRADGTWPLQARHPGQTHFEMEATGASSRWNTLRALRVLKHFQRN